MPSVSLHNPSLVQDSNAPPGLTPRTAFESLLKECVACTASQKEKSPSFQALYALIKKTRTLEARASFFQPLFRALFPTDRTEEALRPLTLRCLRHMEACGWTLTSRAVYGALFGLFDEHRSSILGYHQDDILPECIGSLHRMGFPWHKGYGGEKNTFLPVLLERSTLENTTRFLHALHKNSISLLPDFLTKEEGFYQLYSFVLLYCDEEDDLVYPKHAEQFGERVAPYFDWIGGHQLLRYTIEKLQAFLVSNDSAPVSTHAISCVLQCLHRYTEKACLEETLSQHSSRSSSSRRRRV